MDKLSTNCINPNPNISRNGKYGALESYNGDNGPGELCSMFIMERGMVLSEEFGIGLCTINHSNHFLAAAPYLEVAAERGYLGLIFSRAEPGMGILDSSRLIGNNPLGFGTATNRENPILLDICLAYTSYGNLNESIKSGCSVPSFWGTNSMGLPTTDPAEIMNGGIPLAIGGHKGFGLALLVEILTGILSGGNILNEQNPEHANGLGSQSQTVIVIKPDGLMSAKAYKDRVTEVLERLEAQAPGIRIPDKTSHENRMRMISENAVLLKQELMDKLNAWAVKLGTDLLEI